MVVELVLSRPSPKGKLKVGSVPTLEIKSSSLLNKGCNILHYGFSKVNTSPNKGRGHLLL
jgi:hypothetical protein